MTRAIQWKGRLMEMSWQGFVGLGDAGAVRGMQLIAKCNGLSFGRKENF